MRRMRMWRRIWLSSKFCFCHKVLDVCWYIQKVAWLEIECVVMCENIPWFLDTVVRYGLRMCRETTNPRWHHGNIKSLWMSTDRIVSIRYVVIMGWMVSLTKKQEHLDSYNLKTDKTGTTYPKPPSTP